VIKIDVGASGSVSTLFPHPASAAARNTLQARLITPAERRAADVPQALLDEAICTQCSVFR
jgi:hypothetical protein